MLFNAGKTGWAHMDASYLEFVISAQSSKSNHQLVQILQTILQL